MTSPLCDRLPSRRKNVSDARPRQLVGRLFSLLQPGFTSGSTTQPYLFDVAVLLGPLLDGVDAKLQVVGPSTSTWFRPNRETLPHISRMAGEAPGRGSANRSL